MSPESPLNSEMIAVRGLTKKLARQEILRGVDLDVPKGETLVIIGRSGGGKSVLLKHLVGLMQPDAGEIWIEGQNIIGMSERALGAIRQKIGILFQGAALFDSMTVADSRARGLRRSAAAASSFWGFSGDACSKCPMNTGVSAESDLSGA